MLHGNGGGSTAFAVYQGENDTASSNKYLGTLVASQVAGSEHNYKTTISIDSNGLLNLTVLDAEHDIHEGRKKRVPGESHCAHNKQITFSPHPAAEH